MSKQFFSIGAEGISQEKIAEEIEALVAKKKSEGVYNNISLNSDYDFLKLSNEEDFIKYYLKIIRHSWEIDVNDFEIPRKKGFVGYCEHLLKKIIWKLLKFYTYRLFSQQIEFNSQIRNAIIAVHEDISSRIEILEKRLDKIEKNKK